MDDVHLALYADADFAGCIDSLRSTSGGHLNIQGPNTRFPLSGSSKRQGCVSHSTSRGRDCCGRCCHAIDGYARSQVGRADSQEVTELCVL